MSGPFDEEKRLRILTIGLAVCSVQNGLKTFEILVSRIFKNRRTDRLNPVIVFHVLPEGTVH